MTNSSTTASVAVSLARLDAFVRLGDRDPSVGVDAAAAPPSFPQDGGGDPLVTSADPGESVDTSQERGGVFAYRRENLMTLIDDLQFGIDRLRASLARLDAGRANLDRHNAIVEGMVLQPRAGGEPVKTTTAPPLEEKKSNILSDIAEAEFDYDPFGEDPDDASHGTVW